MMNQRTNVRAGGVMLMLLLSVVGVQGLAAPAEASSRVVHATGTSTLVDVSFVEVVPRGQQCLLYVDQVTTLEGTLEGTSTTVSPAVIRYFATCEDVFATGGAGIVSTYRSVAHFVGVDGEEATLRAVGRTDAAGDYQGIITVHGDLNGVLHETASAPLPGSPFVSTWEGILIVGD